MINHGNERQPNDQYNEFLDNRSYAPPSAVIPINTSQSNSLYAERGYDLSDISFARRPIFSHVGAQTYGHESRIPIWSTEINHARESRNVGLSNEIPNRSVSSQTDAHELRSRQNDVSQFVERPRSSLLLGSFSGRSSLDQFLKRFQIIRAQNQWGNLESKNQLICSLTEDAAELILEGELDELETTEDVIRKLQDRYSNRSYQALYQVQLSTKRQGRDESLGALASEVQKLVTRAYPGRNTPHRDAIAVKAFLDAVEDREVSLKSWESNPRTLDEAYAAAVRYEGFKRAEYSNVRHSNRYAHRVKAVNVNNRDRFDNRGFRFNGRGTNDVNRRQPLGNQNSFYRRPQQNQNRRGMMDRQWQMNPHRERRCHYCNELYHFWRHCPYRMEQQGNDYVNGNQNDYAAQTNNVRYVKGSDSAYLKMSLYGRETLCLLDTGSQMALAPARLVKGRDLRPSTQNLVAANNSKIQVIGETKLKLKLNGRIYWVKALVTPQISQVLLGLSFMRENNVVWHCQKDWIELDGQRAKLHFRSEASQVRRIAAAQDVVVPALSEVENTERASVNCAVIRQVSAQDVEAVLKPLWENVDESVPAETCVMKEGQHERLGTIR